MTDPGAPLPTLVAVTQAFSQRMPSQRVQDTITRAEGGGNMGELMQTQPFRVVAFRALLKQFPDRDPASMWLFSYDVEVEIVDVDPTNGSSPTPEPLSGVTGVSIPTP